MKTGVIFFITIIVPILIMSILFYVLCTYKNFECINCGKELTTWQAYHLHGNSIKVDLCEECYYEAHEKMIKELLNKNE